MGILHSVAFPEKRNNLFLRKKIRLDRRGKVQSSGRDKICFNAAGGKIPAKLTQDGSCVIKASRGILELSKKSFDALLVQCRSSVIGFYNKPGIPL